MCPYGCTETNGARRCPRHSVSRPPAAPTVWTTRDELASLKFDPAGDVPWERECTDCPSKSGHVVIQGGGAGWAAHRNVVHGEART